jgi:hypothetical protein
MTEDITKYNFDFKRDINALQRYIGPAGNNIIWRIQLASAPRGRDHEAVRNT